MRSIKKAWDPLWIIEPEKVFDIIVFTTGRGTPGGFAAPSFRISSNTHTKQSEIFGSSERRHFP
jgi:hypothetical protein